MTRQATRVMTRTMTTSAKPNADISETRFAQESALALLKRSIDFGHAPLAVIRLSVAVQAGSEIPYAHWAYCEEAALYIRDSALKSIWLNAASRRPKSLSTVAN